MKPNVNLILKEYDEKQALYNDFAASARQLVSTLLTNDAILVHSVTHRCKSRQSLDRKISRPDKNYSSLADLTDISAIRITTYFAEDVDLVAKLIEQEFSIDVSESVDKRVSEEPDRFGYSSLHFIASFNPVRSKLKEYRSFAKMRFEIQIRSILQHAWAEIEHDLGYKSSKGVPAIIRRQFARVAGLLELADSEFQSIRRSLIEYEREVPQSIERDPNSVTIDIASLRALFNVDSYTKKLDDEVVNASGYILAKRSNDISAEDVERLACFDIRTIGQLEKIAKDEAQTVRKFTAYWTNAGGDGEAVNTGIGIFYLAYVLAWRTADEKKVSQYLISRKIGLGSDDGNLVRRILDFEN